MSDISPLNMIFLDSALVHSNTVVTYRSRVKEKTCVYPKGSKFRVKPIFPLTHTHEMLAFPNAIELETW